MCVGIDSDHHMPRPGMFDLRHDVFLTFLPTIVDCTLSLAGGQDCHGDAVEKFAPGSY